MKPSKGDSVFVMELPLFVKARVTSEISSSSQNIVGSLQFLFAVGRVGISSAVGEGVVD